MGNDELRRSIDYDRTDGADGVTIIHQRHKVESMRHVDEDYYIVRDSAGHLVRLASCRLNASFPLCVGYANVPSGSVPEPPGGVEVQYSFSFQIMPQWSELDAGVKSLVSSFVANRE